MNNTKRIEKIDIGNTNVYTYERPYSHYTYKPSSSLIVNGSVTIDSQGIATNFSKNSYISFSKNLFPDVSREFEIQVKAYHDTWDLSQYQSGIITLINSEGFRFYINPTSSIYISITNSNYAKTMGSNDDNCRFFEGFKIANQGYTWLYFVLKNTNGKMIMQTRDKNYEILHTKVFDSFPTPEGVNVSNAYFGATFTKQYPFTNGKIDLKESYFRNTSADWVTY